MPKITGYTITWTSTNTEHHRWTVSAAELAAMIGVDVAAVLAAGTYGPAISNLDGTRGLEDGLADIEDSDTEESVDGPYRDNITIDVVTGS